MKFGQEAGVARQQFADGTTRYYPATPEGGRQMLSDAFAMDAPPTLENTQDAGMSLESVAWQPFQPHDHVPDLALLRAFGFLRDPADPELFDLPMEPLDGFMFDMIKQAILWVHSAVRSDRLTLSTSDLADLHGAAAKALKAAGYGPGHPMADFDVDYREAA